MSDTKKHDTVRNALERELNQYRKFDASRERWIRPAGERRRRVDVLLKRKQWDGLKRSTRRYGFEIKWLQTARLSTQLQWYSDAGVTPVAVLPHPYQVRTEVRGNWTDYIAEAERNARHHCDSLVYYIENNERDEIEWGVYRPYEAGLGPVDWPTFDELLYSNR